MMRFRLVGAARARRTLSVAAAALVVAGGLITAPAQAETQIEVWHALNAHNAEVFQNLVKQFNRDQDDVRVKLKAFDDPDALEAQLAELARKKGALPQLAQLDDNRAPNEMDGRPFVKPLYSVLAKHPIKDATWFVAPDHGFTRDEKGRLLAFPYMGEVPVMFYNVSAFKKAGIQPTTPDRSWSGLQGQLVDLANKATRQCPVTSDQPVSINLENLAAVNNQFFTSQQPAASGKGKAKAAPAGGPSFTFDTVYVRHLSLMISWVRSELMVKPGYDGRATQRFVNNECAVLLSESGNLGWFRDKSGLDFGVSGLPYYPEVTKKPGNPFVDGTALWMTIGQSAAQEQAVASLLAWLAQPKRAAEWYQRTGFLPLTEQAFAATGADYYKNLGDWKNLVKVYNQPAAVTSRAIELRNYPKIRTMFHETLRRALSGEQPAVTALHSASSQASQLLREK